MVPLASDNKITECGICLDTFKDPHMTACGHNFCNLCITSHRAANGDNCPICRGAVLQTFPNLFVRETIEAAAINSEGVANAVVNRANEGAPILLNRPLRQFSIVRNHFSMLAGWLISGSLLGAVSVYSSSKFSPVVPIVFPIFSQMLKAIGTPRFSILHMQWRALPHVNSLVTLYGFAALVFGTVACIILIKILKVFSQMILPRD